MTRHAGLLRGIPLALVLGVAAVALVAVMIVGVGLGPLFISPGLVVDLFFSGLSRVPAEGPLQFIVWELRTPRVLTAALVGAALAAAGCAVQSLVANPIADPYVLGMSSGAGVAAVLVLTGFGASAIGGLVLPAAAFAGAVAAGILVVVLAAPGRGITAARLVLVGVAVAQLLGGLMSLIIVRADDPGAAQLVMFWLLGSLANSSWALLLIVVVPISIGLLALLGLSRRLDLISLGDASAADAGVSPERTRLVFFAVAALLTGSAVAVSGTIGFVGLVVPHLARLLVGARHHRVIPTSALLGGILLVGADLAARTLLEPAELPVGIFTAFLGVPVFVALLHRTGLR